MRAHNGAQVGVLVLAPAHDAPGTRWVVDETEAHTAAEQRLRKCLACLDEAGIDAEAWIADPDPVQAIEDALETFPADEIVFVTRPTRHSGWLHHEKVIDHVRRTFRQPVEDVVGTASSS